MNGDYPSRFDQGCSIVVIWCFSAGATPMTDMGTEQAGVCIIGME